jgi:MOSC domain-containing protein
MSEGSLQALGVPDPRRFRMTITIDGVEPWEEHGWSGRELVAGDAMLRVTEPVPRCVVTTRDPDSGRRDAPTLKALATLRGRDDVTFGVWCEVVAPGRVLVGDQVAIAT